MATKKFKDNATLDFITEKTETVPEVQTDIPLGYMIAPEPKTERLQLLVKKSISKEIKQQAKKEKISINELCGRIFERYYTERRKGNV